MMEGVPLIGGGAAGPLLWTPEPLSFWGGYDAETGEITDRSHPLSGVHGAGVILAVPETRGSSTTTAVLLESIRRGTAPAGFVTRGVDSFLTLAAVVAEEMYGTAPPVVSVAVDVFERLGELQYGVTITLGSDGRIAVVASGPGASEEE